MCLGCRNLPGLRVRHLCSSAGSPLPGIPASGDLGFLLHKVSVSVFIEQKAEQQKGPPQVDLASILFSYLCPWSFQGLFDTDSSNGLYTPGFPPTFDSLEFVLLT